MTGSLLRMNIRGTAGRTLADKWAAGPRTYLGLQINGFPNLFTITGPESPSVLVNMTLFMKADSWYVGANIPGKKRVFMPYVGGNVEYCGHCNESAKMG